MSNYGNSSFWLDQDSNIDVLTGEKLKPGKDLVKLASYQRAIGNFVNIVTGENIPVNFTGKDSYTDGKSVVIGSDLKDSNFDSAVGLALHEGSHIKLTDFNILKNLSNIIESQLGSCEDEMSRRDTIKDLINIIEDRRIDYFIFKTSPGYKGYYHAMYDKYFNAKIIDKALKLGEKNENTWDDYLFHICNFANQNRNLTVLPQLQSVWNMIDLKNISRLDSTAEVTDLAMQVFELVDQTIPKQKSEDQKSEPTKGPGQTSGSPADDGSKAEGDEAIIQTESGNGNGGTNGSPSQLSEAQERQLEKAILKQGEFLSGDSKKKTLSKKDLKSVSAIADSGVTEENVGMGNFNNGRAGKTGTTCLLIEKLTSSLIESGVYSDVLISNDNYYASRIPGHQNNIDKGLRLGAMLGRKLQIRNEERTLKTTRLPKGKIDSRLISSLGFGAENIFQTMQTQKYKSAIVHLSIDASGSMSGSRFDKSMMSAVAIAKAASMTNNFDVQISFRSTCHSGGFKPLALIAYDSRYDNISKISKLFKFIYPGGTTPEGLCFEALQKHLKSSAAELDSYFINFSDGAPYFGSKDLRYYGDYAIEHTKKEVKKMRDKGIVVMSYFIDGSKYDLNNFQRMYGKTAQNIKVNELMPLAKSLNKMFI